MILGPVFWDMFFAFLALLALSLAWTLGWRLWALKHHKGSVRGSFNEIDVEARQLLEKTLKEVSEQATATAQKCSTELMEKYAEHQREHLKKLDVELADAHQNEVAKVRKEVQQFGEVEKKRVAAKIQQQAEKVLGDIVGKNISPKDHEELIMKGLEQAKSDGLL